MSSRPGPVSLLTGIHESPDSTLFDALHTIRIDIILSELLFRFQLHGKLGFDVQKLQ